MVTQERIEAHLARQPEPKQTDLRRLHAHMLAEFPGSRLWFNDGTYGASIGKASVTGYCIRFRRLAVINAEALHAAIRHGMTVDHGN